MIVPSLPGCVTYGATVEDARSMACDAIAVYLQSLKKHGVPSPNGLHLVTVFSEADDDVLVNALIRDELHATAFGVG